MSVYYDLQAAQSLLHPERGIARYVREVALALEAHRPDLMSGYLVNPACPVPPELRDGFSAGRVLPADAARATARVLHVTSPYESGPRLDALLPVWARRTGTRLAVTLYDVIPEVFPERYFVRRGMARHYRMRTELVRRADRVLAISEATAHDAVHRLGVPPDRVVVVGAGVSPEFRPPASVADARRAVAARFPGVGSDYLLYTGGTDYRKNLQTLLTAFSRMPAAMREAHHLVIVCSLEDGAVLRHSEELTTLGVADHVHLVGKVSDGDLVLLYQACGLFVFPSLYEGYGLPVAEALACGAPVVCARTSSLVELVTRDEALFDPYEPDSIRAAVERALVDPVLRDRLRTPLGPGHAWADVARRTAAVYEELAQIGHRRHRRRRRIAFVSPLPPAPSGVAQYSHSLLGELSSLCDVDVFVDGGAGASLPPAGVTAHPIQHFPKVESVRGGYDSIVYSIGNQTVHASALHLLRHRPGPVIAHDLRLNGLYAWCAVKRPELVPGGFQSFLQQLYLGRVPAELGSAGFLDYREADAHGVYMAGEVIALSTHFFTHSEVAATIARSEAPDHAAKVAVLPFAMPAAPVMSDGDDTAPLVTSFGVADPIKQSPLILEAFPHLLDRCPTGRLAIVGPMPAVVQDEYRSRATELGVADRVDITGRVSNEEYWAWMSKTTLAVQLRASWGGEASAAIADCFAAGVPVLATGTGWTAGLPANTIDTIEVDVSALQLGERMAALLEDEPHRRRVRAAALALVGERSFRAVAAALYGALFPVKDATTASKAPATSSKDQVGAKAR